MTRVIAAQPQRTQDTEKGCGSECPPHQHGSWVVANSRVVTTLRRGVWNQCAALDLPAGGAGVLRDSRLRPMSPCAPRTALVSASPLRGSPAPSQGSLLPTPHHLLVALHPSGASFFQKPLLGPSVGGGFGVGAASLSLSCGPGLPPGRLVLPALVCTLRALPQFQCCQVIGSRGEVEGGPSESHGIESSACPGLADVVWGQGCGQPVLCLLPQCWGRLLSLGAGLGWAQARTGWGVS